MKTPEELLKEYDKILCRYRHGQAMRKMRSKGMQQRGIEKINLALAQARQLSSEAGKVRKRLRVLKKQRKKGYPRVIYSEF